ncbi:MAG: hypothetical protein ACK4ND_15730 [Cytophagaceae bacterium]
MTTGLAIILAGQGMLDLQGAMAHLLFNLTMSLLALSFLTPLGKLVQNMHNWRMSKRVGVPSEQVD